MLNWIRKHRGRTAFIGFILYMPLYTWLLTIIPQNLQQGWAMVFVGMILWIGFLMWLAITE